MKTILLAGFSAQEAAAIDILVSMSWRDYQCKNIGVVNINHPQTVAQTSDRMVIASVVGLGIRSCTPENIQLILNFLSNRPAVLLIPGFGEWPTLFPSLLPKKNTIALVTTPHSSASLKASIQTAMSWESAAPLTEKNRPTTFSASLSEKSATKSINSKQATELSLTQRILAGEVSLASQKEIQISPFSSIEAPIGIEKGAFENLISAIPTADTHFLNLIVRVIKTPIPYTLTIGSSFFFIDAKNEWASASVPISAILKTFNTAQIFEEASLVALDESHPDAAILLRGDARQNRIGKRLELVIWELVSRSLKDMPLKATQDISFRLRRFPNFTQIEQTTALDLQLAAICSRSPQSLYRLFKTIPQREADIMRFVILCIMTGSLEVIPGKTLAVIPEQPRFVSPERRGLFRSLLDKLF